MKKQVSDKQQKANMKNALKGGVKTPEGKDIVRFNARKHGILSSLIADYEDDFYKQYLDQLFEELRPTTLLENILVERMALHYLKLYRLAKAESEFMKSCLSTPSELMMMITSIENRGYVPEVSHLDIQQLLTIYARYEISIENRLYRAMHELKNCRKN